MKLLNGIESGTLGSIGLLCGVGITALMTASAVAQDSVGADSIGGIQEIIVTAGKMGASNILSTPIAVSAFSADALSNSHINSTRDLAQIVPSLAVSQFSTYAQIYIRGVGSNNSFNGSDPSVTVHADGVYLARPFAQFTTFLDVERVEVLRGPQGTLYGRNSAGGTINIISRAPGDDVRARLSGIYGNYDHVELGGYISGPIIPGKVQASLAGSFTQHDPYRENIVATGNDVDDEDSHALRGQIRIELSDNIVATTRADYALAKPHIVGFSVLQTPFSPVTNTILGDYKKVALDYPNFSRTQIWGISEAIDFTFSDNLSLESITAYRDSKSRSQQDGDSSDQTILNVNLGERAKQFTQEFNLVGDAGSLHYVLGLFYFNEKVQSDSRLSIFPANARGIFRPYTKTEAYAAYAQATYDLSSAFALIVGGRYSEETKDFDQSIDRFLISNGAQGPSTVYSARRKFTSFTPKLGLNWTPNSNILAYVSATRGFKSGGFNFNSADPAQGYDPEKLWSYEAGLKTRWFGNRLIANLTAFRYDYKDLQVNAFVRPGQTDIVNAASATVAGLELETTARPVPGLELIGNFALLDAEYKNYPDAPIGGTATIDASGNRLNNAPKFTMNLAAQYDYELGGGDAIFIRGEFAHRSQTYFTALNAATIGQKAYDLVNASLGYKAKDGRWKIEVFGRNLTDEEYVLNVYTSSPVPAGLPGAPQTYGVRLNWNY